MIIKKPIAILLLIILTHFSLTIFISHYALTIYPNTGDEHSILFQSKIFSHLHLTAQAPPFPDLFATDYLQIYQDKWFSQYPPVYSLMILPGLMFDQPLLTVAIYSSLTLWILYLLLSLVLKSKGSLPVLVFCCLWALSPTFLFHASSYYNHIGALFVYSLALLCLFKFLDLGRQRHLLALSALLGVGFGIRPFTFFLLSIPIFLAILPKALSKTSAWKTAKAFLPGLLILGALAFYNFNQTHEWTDFSYLNAGQNLHKLSFANLNMESIIRVFSMIDDTAKWLFASGVFKSMNLKENQPGDLNAGNLLFLATMIYLAVTCFWRKSSNPLLQQFRRLSFFSILILIGGHLFYDWSGGRFGERFFFEITWLILFHFSALVIDVCTSIRSASLRRTVLVTFFVLLNMGSLLVYLPQTAEYLRRSNQKRMDLFIETDSKSFETSVIHILSPPEMLQNWYARNNPDLSGTIYLPFSSMMISDLQQTFKGRTHYVYIFNQKAGNSTLVPLEEFLSLPPATR